jgi:hypothetical protein
MSRDPFKILEKNLLLLGENEQIEVEYKWNYPRYISVYKELYKKMEKESILKLIKDKKNTSTILEISIYNNFKNPILLYPLTKKF